MGVAEFYFDCKGGYKMQEKLTQFIVKYACNEISKEKLERAMEREHLFLRFNKAQWISFINGLRGKNLEYQELVMEFLSLDEVVITLFKKQPFKELIYKEWMAFYDNKDNSLYVRKGIQSIAEKLYAPGIWIRNNNLTTGVAYLMTAMTYGAESYLISWFSLPISSNVLMVITGTAGITGVAGVACIAKSILDLINKKVVEIDRVEQIEQSQGKRCCGLW